MRGLKMAYSIDEAAESTGIGKNTLRKLIEWQKLPVLKVGRKFLIRSDTIETFMELNEGNDLRNQDEVKAVYHY
jgi:excisionase family DNA binding protein